MLSVASGGVVYLYDDASHSYIASLVTLHDVVKKHGVVSIQSVPHSARCHHRSWSRSAHSKLISLTRNKHTNTATATAARTSNASVSAKGDDDDWSNAWAEEEDDDDSSVKASPTQP